MARTPDIKTLVSVVADGLLQREREPAVIEKLVAAGVPPSEAPTIYRRVKAACQQGVQAVVTDGLSAPNGPPQDPLLAEAFRVGQANMRSAIRTPWTRRPIAVLGAALVLAAIIWFLLR